VIVMIGGVREGHAQQTEYSLAVGVVGQATTILTDGDTGGAPPEQLLYRFEKISANATQIVYENTNPLTIFTRDLAPRSRLSLSTAPHSSTNASMSLVLDGYCPGGKDLVFLSDAWENSTSPISGLIFSLIGINPLSLEPAVMEFEESSTELCDAVLGAIVVPNFRAQVGNGK
jgi:hypothetical protein